MRPFSPLQSQRCASLGMRVPYNCLLKRGIFAPNHTELASELENSSRSKVAIVSFDCHQN